MELQHRVKSRYVHPEKMPYIPQLSRGDRMKRALYWLWRVLPMPKSLRSVLM
jgi:hypothetical protein